MDLDHRGVAVVIARHVPGVRDDQPATAQVGLARGELQRLFGNRGAVDADDDGRAHVDPFGQGLAGGCTTATGQVAWCSTPWLTDPNSAATRACRE